MNEVARIEPIRAVAPITPMDMLKTAVDQGADLDKLSKLMDLQQRWEAGEAKKAYVAALSAFRAECPTINRKQSGHNSRKYAGLADALDQINGLLAKHGLSHSWRTSQDGNLITVTCCVTHAGSHSECTSLQGLPDTSGSKNAIQSVGSTVSYLQRYTLFAILGLASAEQDDDGAASDDAALSHACDQLLAAPDLKTLQAVFKAAWDAHPKGRSILTGAKDQRKRELQS